MLDIAWTELLIIAVVAILVVGPRELPRMLRAIGNFMGQMRRMAGDFQRQFNDAIRETELDEVRRGIDSVRSANPLNKFKDDLNPLKQAGESVRKAVEDPGAPKPAVSGRSSGAAGASTTAAAKSERPAASSATATAPKTTASKASPAKRSASGSASAKPAAAKAKPAAAKTARSTARTAKGGAMNPAKPGSRGSG